MLQHGTHPDGLRNIPRCQRCPPALPAVPGPSICHWASQVSIRLKSTPCQMLSPALGRDTACQLVWSMHAWMHSLVVAWEFQAQAPCQPFSTSAGSHDPSASAPEALGAMSRHSEYNTLQSSCLMHRFAPTRQGQSPPPLVIIPLSNMWPSLYPVYTQCNHSSIPFKWHSPYPAYTPRNHILMPIIWPRPCRAYIQCNRTSTPIMT